MMTRASITIGLSFTLSAATLGAGCAEERPTPAPAAEATPLPAAPTLSAADKVERGRYLVTTSGCGDCHTPLKMGDHGPEPDITRALSGHPEGLELPAPPALPPGPWMATVAATMTAWSGPWGVSFTANLTPDPETGLGKWTAKTFIDTIRNGRHMGAGRPLLPPMPSAGIAKYTDEDLESIFAYLQTLPAVRNRVPRPIPPSQSAGPAAAPAGADGKLSRK